ncbi:MAG: hypothetical protein A3G34_05160 [Candidatus Lindowbacteria bacterium RIFCSPLOWO2_12_FULL_62_27]|nr:MAG: hypothetical protein A3G34_05160 [Candidatus Lindowbacteria bacterium RIFCSPLOWO2_12_FULL_62_27]
MQDWQRYLSPRFYHDKLREKGVGWCLRRGSIGLFQLMVVILTCPLSFLLYLIGIRFLPIAAQHIGHLVCEPDCYVKEGILGMPRHSFVIVLVKPNRVSNPHLLQYWRQHLRIISSPLLYPLLAPLSWSPILQIDIRHYFLALRSTAHYYAVQKAWAERPPLLALSESDRECGLDCLRTLGVPEDGWFVSVHCRESGYAPNEAQTYRNADIHNYILAMKAIVEKGGWCIRMGDATMKPLPPMEHVIDYAHLSVKSDWMDIFLCASCKFFLGGSSSLSGAACVFGVPSAVANQAPMAVILPTGSGDLGIPKLVWSRDRQRYLTFGEVLGSTTGDFRATSLFTDAGLMVEENSPEDIKDLALEMLDAVRGAVKYTDEDARLQERFKSLLRPGHYSYGGRARVGKEFLRKYASLLSPA